MPKTAKGIYHNLRESKYTISNNEVVFYFSSNLYRDKFLKEYKINRKLFKKKIDDNPLNMDTLSDVLLYQKIEKRGFFVRLDRAMITFNDLYKYSLRKMNEQNSPDWRVI
jgi:hypothetical protein